jgi:hypothetical protein
MPAGAFGAAAVIGEGSSAAGSWEHASAIAVTATENRAKDLIEASPGRGTATMGTS